MKPIIIFLIFLGFDSLIYSQTIPILRLKEIEFKPSTITPYVYTPADNSSSVSALQESLWRQEQQIYAVGDKYVNFCKMLGKISMDLYSDENLMAWYSVYEEKKLKEIEANWKSGNYLTVSRLIDERTMEICNDRQLLCRLDASDKYKKFRDSVIDKYSGQLLCEWWIDSHPFLYEDCLNEHGQVMGYKMTELKFPLESFPWIDHMMYVRNNILSGKKYTPEIGGKLFDYFSSGNAIFQESIAQDYQVEVWYYQKELSSKSSVSSNNWMISQKELLYNQDSLITPREYYIRRLSSWLK